MRAPVAELLRRANKALSDLYEMADPDALSLPQREALKALITGPKTQKALRKLASLDRSTTSEMLQRMQIDGLVTMARSELDGRSVVVTITKDGLKAFRKAERAMEAAEVLLLRRVAAVQRAAFVAGLSAACGGAGE